MALGQGAGLPGNWDTVWQNPSSGSGSYSGGDSGGGYDNGSTAGGVDWLDSPYTNPSDSGGLGNYNSDQTFFNTGQLTDSTAGGYDSGAFMNGATGDGYYGFGSDGSFMPNDSAYSGMNTDFGTPSNYVTGNEVNGFFGRDVEKLAKNPLVKFLMNLHPATALVNALARGPNSTGSFLGGMFGSSLGGPIGGLLGSSAGNAAGDMFSGKDVSLGSFMPSAGGVGGLAGSFLGANSGLDFGGQLGGFLGSQVGNMAGQAINSPSIGGQTGMSSASGPGDAMGGIGGLLFGNGNSSGLLGLGASALASNAQGKSLSSQINNLNSLFSANSPYAQEMRKQLERRDAAAGRRSQYGNREVELQAKLATLAAQQAPQISQLTDKKNANRNLLLATALKNPALMNAVKGGANSLFDLFSSPSSNPSFNVDPAAYSNGDYSTLNNMFSGGFGSLGNGDTGYSGFGDGGW